MSSTEAPTSLDWTEYIRSRGLPRGRVLIEASAGTGKTHTLAALATLFLALGDADGEQVRIDELLLVTFSRAAAGELRARVRERLQTVAAALEGSESAAASPSHEDFVVEYLRGDHVDEILARIYRAIDEFDRAPITTIHGFAQQIRTSLGSRLPGDPAAQLVEDTRELVAEVVGDLLSVESLRRLGVVESEPFPTVREITDASVALLNHPGMQTVEIPFALGTDGARLQRAALITAVCEEVERRRRRTGTVGFGDLLTQLHSAIALHPELSGQLQRRFRVVLIDEFQDTDVQQWEIFNRLFGVRSDGGALLLVGDPKQAIYGFRGGDIYAYLRARDAVEEEGSSQLWSLSHNYRSDGALLAALNALLEGSTFGSDRIHYVPVSAPLKNAGSRIEWSDGLRRGALEVRLELSGSLAEDRDEAIANDLAVQVRDHLERLLVPDDDGNLRELLPSDICVLVTAHAHALPIQRALGALKIPAVTLRQSNVMTTTAGRQWRDLFYALARPSDPARARRAALGWFFPDTAVSLTEGAEQRLGEVQEQLARWSQLLLSAGLSETMRRIRIESGVVARVLGALDGERNATDLIQIAGVFQRRSPHSHPSATALVALYDELTNEGDDEEGPKILARQIETEARAVKIMTVHAAKGLEFPVVFIPRFFAHRANSSGVKTVVEVDPTHADYGVAKLLVGKFDGRNRSAEDDRLAALEQAQELGERQRDLYVALTRARHRLVVWWAPELARSKSLLSPLSRLLFHRESGVLAPHHSTVPATIPSDVPEFLRNNLLPAKSDAMIDLVDLSNYTPVFTPWKSPSDPDGIDLAAAVITRTPPRLYRRWSFSAMTEGVHEGTGVRVNDPLDESMGDQGAADELVPCEEGRDPLESGSVASDLLLGDLPGGTIFGTFVHKILEEIDFTAGDLAGAIAVGIDRRLPYLSLELSRDELIEGLLQVLAAPLGELCCGRSLQSFSPSDRLNELSFELNFAAATPLLNVRDIGTVMLRHLDSEETPVGLLEWASALDGGRYDIPLVGHLTGEIDLVLRVRGDASKSEPRYVICDYKTNRLAPLGQVPRAIHYVPERLLREMCDADYLLQALLYSVALHRYLRARQRNYQPELHLGGIAYLFVRGMSGEQTVTDDGVGVFSWRPPAALIIELSDLFAGMRP